MTTRSLALTRSVVIGVLFALLMDGLLMTLIATLLALVALLLTDEIASKDGAS